MKSRRRPLSEERLPPKSVIKYTFSSLFSILTLLECSLYLMKISRVDEISNEENETRTMLNSIWIRKHRWRGHVLQHDELLCKLMERRMVGKPVRGRRRLQMLEDHYQNNSYEVLKRTASAWRDCMRKKVPKTGCW